MATKIYTHGSLESYLMESRNSCKKSVGVWCELGKKVDSADPKPQMSLHFNYWRRGGSKQASRDFLDVGLLITKSDAINVINIFVPVAIQISDVEDLGGQFKETDIATGIFNERLTVNYDQNRHWVSLKRSEGNSIFVYNFADSLSASISAEPVSSGTVLTLKADTVRLAQQGLDSGQEFYFRIRVKLPPNAENLFIATIKPKDRWLLSGFDKIEYIDFRLNEARNLPSDIERKMTLASEKGRVQIKRVDFLLVVSVRADLVGGHKNFHKSRLLETELWKSYVANGKEAGVCDDMVIYHWREKVDAAQGANKYIDDFSAFAKLRIRLSNVPIVAVYLLVFFLIGITSGVMGSAIWQAISERSSISGPGAIQDAKVPGGVDNSEEAAP